MLGSIFLGTNGSYDINGIEVNFVDNAEGDAVFGNSLFGRVADLMLSNTAVKILTFGYLHVFIHEMGHALAGKLRGYDSVVNIYTQSCRGSTAHGASCKFTALAGPLAGMALELVKLVGAIAAVILLPSFVGLPLGLFLGAGSAFWLFGETMYALVGDGDWATIRG
jgi:hypothetical protein